MFRGFQLFLYHQHLNMDTLRMPDIFCFDEYLRDQVMHNSYRLISQYATSIGWCTTDVLDMTADRCLGIDYGCQLQMKHTAGFEGREITTFV